MTIKLEAKARLLEAAPKIPPLVLKLMDTKPNSVSQNGGETRYHYSAAVLKPTMAQWKQDGLVLKSKSLPTPGISTRIQRTLRAAFGSVSAKVLVIPG